jgi:hypothetical protein
MPAEHAAAGGMVPALEPRRLVEGVPGRNRSIWVLLAGEEMPALERRDIIAIRGRLIMAGVCRHDDRDHTLYLGEGR